MGIANFIFGNESERTKIGPGIIVDATTNIVTSRKATITESAVESGADVSDHARVGPKTLVLDCFVSDSPTDEMQSFLSSVAGGVLGGVLGKVGANSKIGGASLVGTGLGAALGSRAGKIAMSAFGSARGEDYPKQVFQDLFFMQENFAIIDIQTFFMKGTGDQAFYKDMIITDLSVPQTAADGNGLRFQLTARNIRIVTLNLTDVKGQFMIGSHPANSAEKKADRGKQGTKKAESKTSDNATILYKTFVGK